MTNLLADLKEALEEMKQAERNNTPLMTMEELYKEIINNDR